MYDDLISYINNQLAIELSEEEIHVIKSTFKPKKLRKHQYFLQEGEVCKLVGFIVKGALKQYTVDSSGKENVLELYIENWWVADRESFSKDIPSPYFIDAFEATEMLVLSKEDYLKNLSTQRFIIDLQRTLSERQSLKLLKRVHTIKTLTAEQRLSDLEEHYPEFFQRFPQHIIASYLGMTKETLSRIRGSSIK
jgi:CRP-like cAMP-binding protein